MIRGLRSILKRVRSAATAPLAPALPAPPTLATELAGRGSTVERFVAAKRIERGRLYATLPAVRVEQLLRDCEPQAAATINAADRVCRHEFDLLGSGPFVPVDPGRVAKGPYRPIDWYLDPIQNLRFRERVPHKAWNLLEMRPGLADVKLPWELARCQHWLPLAQAFRLSGDDRYVDEILHQHDDFMEANPVGFGINWTCTMDVALRAFNWALAIEIVHGSSTADPARFGRAFASLVDHGGFIEQNLENTYEVTSNHFLSNVVGLYALGVLFQELPCGQRWLQQCRSWLEQEMRVQVLDDGADYESSIPYHRLVAELFLAGWRLAECEGRPLSNDYKAKLHRMMEFLRDVLRPDGLLPQIGDADDGRVHIFSDYGRWNPQDARHLLSPAAVIFGEPEWAQTQDPWGGWEAAWWGLSLTADTASSPRHVSRLFPDAGVAVVRDADTYLLITNGKVGTNGFGNHKHNDLLSFEFHQLAVPLFVDPGSYVYTSDPEARNQFRSTKSHNTVVVDEEEQNEFKPEWLFRLFEKARPEHVEFVTSNEATQYRGQHDGYSRLASPVIHQRAFHLDHRTGTLRIEDSLTGVGTHRLRWRFHCAPGVDARSEAPGLVTLSAKGNRWVFRVDESVATEIASAWYSPSYGVRLACAAIECSAQQDLGARQRWLFSLERR